MKTKFILIIVSILLILLYFLNVPNPDFSSKKYNQKEWVDKPSHRVNMANDIIKNKVFIGKNTAQIQNELGKAHNEPNNIIWKYLLEYKGYLYPEFYFLTIHFNDGIVDKVYIETLVEN